MPICYPHVVNNAPVDRSQLLFLLPTMMLDFWILVIVLSLQLVEVVGSNSAQSFFSLNAPRYKDNSDARWNSNSAGLSYDAGLFAPLEDFSSLSETEFTTFGHPAFPRHNIRIKKTPRGFCDDTAKFVAFAFVVLSRQSVLNENLAFQLEVVTRGTSTLKLVTFSFTSSRAGVIPTRTTSFSGPTEVNPF